MAFGILEPTSNSSPSGTSNIQDNFEDDVSEAHVIRVPQPSQSALDPLNWSKIRKELLFATILLGSSVTGSIGPVLVPGFTVVAQDLGVDVSRMTLLNGLLVMTLGVITSVNLTPVISGYVISDLSWRWSFWLEAIMFGIVLLATFFFFPETTFDRAGPLPLQLENASLDDKAIQVSMVSETLTETSGLRCRSVLGVEAVKLPGLKSFLASIFVPFALLPHPIVIYGSLMWAVTFTWTILLGAVVSQIFTPTPYNMDTIAVGNISGIAPFIGSALGTMMAGWFCDFSATNLAKHNNGTYEPEFRLLVIFPAAIAMAIGSFGLGAAIHNGISAIVCGVFMAIINFAVGLGCTGIVSYTNDACGEKASDAFGIAMFIKSAFAFGLSFIFNDYYTRSGPLVFFSTFGAVTVGVMLTTIPLYVFGKRIRAWADNHDLLRRKSRDLYPQ